MQPEIEVIPIGGHSDFGRNMTAIRVGHEIVIFDMGVKLDPLQGLPEGEGVDTMSANALHEIGAIPDNRRLNEVDGKVVAIVISHAHADHVGAVEVLAKQYPKVPIWASPYTIRFIEERCRPRSRRAASQGKLTIPNRLNAIKGRQQVRIGNHGLQLELVHVTHSIPGATMPVLHTKEGAIVYALDFKLDDTPVIGDKPDYQRLSQIGRDGVRLLVTEATNADKDEKTDSEAVARQRLQDLLLSVDHDDEALFVSTFSSHAARFASILDCAAYLDREVVMLGRSLKTYMSVAAETTELNIPSWAEIRPSRREADHALRRVAEDPTRYMVVLTGHQGEPGAALTRIGNGETAYKMSKRDDVVFASHVIPTETCISQRADLEARLRRSGSRLFKGAHASGHASAVDHRQLLRLLQPEEIVPAHGGIAIQNAYAELASEEGWRLRKDVHVLANGQRYVLGQGPSPVPAHHPEDRVVEVQRKTRKSR